MSEDREFPSILHIDSLHKRSVFVLAVLNLSRKMNSEETLINLYAVPK